MDSNQSEANVQKQFQKLVDDLRDKVAQVDYAEDKILTLEQIIDSMKIQRRSTIQTLEKTIEDYRRTVEEQAESLESTKNMLKDKSSRLSQVEKEVQELKEDRDSVLGELDKSCDEAQLYLNYNISLTAELKKCQEMEERQRHEAAATLEQLKYENSQVYVALELSQASCRRSELERNDLEEIISKSQNQSGTNLFEEFIADDCDEAMGASEVSLETAFPPIEPGKSLFSELQLSLMVSQDQLAETDVSECHFSPLLFQCPEACVKTLVDVATQTEAAPIAAVSNSVSTRHGSNRSWNGIRKFFALLVTLLTLLAIMPRFFGTSLSTRTMFGMTYKYPPRI